MATAVYLLYSKADWFNGSVATTNMVTEIVNSQSNIQCNGSVRFSDLSWFTRMDRMLSTKQVLRVHLIDEEAEKLSAGYMPKNTEKANEMGCGKL